MPWSKCTEGQISDERGLNQLRDFLLTAVPQVRVDAGDAENVVLNPAIRAGNGLIFAYPPDHALNYASVASQDATRSKAGCYFFTAL